MWLALVLWSSCEVQAQDAALLCSAMGAWAVVGRWDQALGLLQELRGRSAADGVAETCAIHAAEASARWELALEILAGGRNPVTGGSCLAVLARAAQWQRALQLLKDLPADAVAYGAAVSACGRAGRWDQALALLRQVEERRVRSSEILWNAAMSACEASAQWQRALLLLDQRSGWAPDAFSFSAGISACGQGRLWQRALVLLRESQASEARDASDVKGGVSLVPLSAAISACGAARQWRWVLQLLEEMCADRVSPNTVTYTSAIASTDRWEAVLALLAEMELRAVDAGVVALASAADTLARPGPLGELLKRAEATALRLLAPEKRVGPASADVGPGGSDEVSDPTADGKSGREELLLKVKVGVGRMAAVDVGPPEPMLQAVMALAAAFLYLSGFTLFIMGRRDSTRAFTTIAVLNTLIAGSAYLGMSQGLFINMVDGRRVFCLRYADWIFSTALCLLDLALMRGASMKNTLLLVSLDVLMIMLVACAATTAWSAGKWQYYGAAVMCFIAVMSILYHVLTTAAEVKGSTDGVDAQRKFKFVASRTMEVWCLYPVIFCLAEMTHTIPVELEVVSYAIADSLAKCPGSDCTGSHADAPMLQEADDTGSQMVQSMGGTESEGLVSPELQCQWVMEAEPAGRNGNVGRRAYEQMLEVVNAVLAGQMPAQNAAELLQPIAAQESLQQVLVDALWLAGFAASEAPATKETRDEFTNFCALLEKEGVVSKPILCAGLETEMVPTGVCNVPLLRKKQNQAKTKARYTVTRFNLLREHNEGYARLIMYIDKLLHLDSDLQGTDAAELDKTRQVIIDDVMLLMGHSYLCPNRIIAMAIDIYEKLIIDEEEPSKRPQALVALLRRFGRDRISKVASFLLSSGPPPANAGKDTKEQNHRLSQFVAVASLIAQNCIDLKTLWSYLEPCEKRIHEAWHMLNRRYEAKLKTVSTVDLSGKSNLARDKRFFNGCVKNFNQMLNQKIRLVEAMISINDWPRACILLTHLRRICKPCMNHYIRTALCDLLKWVIEPLLPKVPGQQRYREMRRFRWGLANGPGEGQIPNCLRQATDLNDFGPATKQVLDQLEFYLHTDNMLMGHLWQVMALSLKDAPGSAVATASAHSAAPSNQILEDRLVAIVYKHLLPAISIAKPCPWLSSVAWNVLKQVTVFQRYMIYSCWETRYNQFMLKYGCEEAKLEAKKILKRVVSSDKSDRDREDPNAYRPHPIFCQLCQTNPIPIVEVMLKDIEIGFNVNMIQPYVDLTSRCSEMMTDVVGYVLARNCERPASETRVFLNVADGFISPWLCNFADFIGRFFKKHPQTNLIGILTVIARRMMNDTETAAGRHSGKKFKGESLIRVVLEKLMEHMGGLIVVKDLTAEQLLCLAGGQRLRLESVSVGTRPDPQRKERTRKALMDSMVDLGLAPALWDCLSKQRLYFHSEGFSEVNSDEGSLKLLCMLLDGNQECFLSLVEFLSQASSREKYLKLVPAFQQIFGVLEPSLAYSSLRPGLAPFARGVAPKTDGDPKAMVATPEEMELYKQLSGVARQCLAKAPEEDGLSMDFFVTFWRLSLQDIFVPAEGYERVLSRIMAGHKSFEEQKTKLDRKYNVDTHSREYKALQRNLARQKEAYDKLKEEQLVQKLNYEKVLARLEQEKNGWFLKYGPEATHAFVAEMLVPRALTSPADALFCCKFARLLIKIKTPGFLVLDFYNSWTLMLSMNLRSCTEREAQICGLFLKEMMAYICGLRKSEKAYEAEMKDNPCFYRHHYDEKMVDTPLEFAKHSDILRGHNKWEGRIYKVLRQNLESEDWTEKRNTLLLLSQSCESYPVVEKYLLKKTAGEGLSKSIAGNVFLSQKTWYARGVLQCVENLRDREKANDLKTLANSLAVKLRATSKSWIKTESKEAPKPGPKPMPKTETKPKEAKEVKEVKDVKEVKEVKETKEVAKPKNGQKKEGKEGKESKEAKEPKDPKKEEREIKRREPPRSNGGEDRPEKRARRDDDAKRRDDDVVMVAQRPASRGTARNSLAVQGERSEGRRNVSSSGYDYSSRRTTQHVHASRHDRRR
ncbi:unnamed protein product [Effrenium voratum]|uniref:Non-specific serine/threonine protein kinase n=1 Tax=Effrenium voratum TaxID=2562239 RepID=A0AA36I5B5_9DINO|nr:unnamed protein product [Effrenium voratum]